MKRKNDLLQNELNLLHEHEIQNFSGIKTFDVNIDKPVELLKMYDSGQELFCSCGKRQRHKQGCLVLFSNGKCGLIGGSTCAVREFGQESWDGLQDSYKISQRDKINTSFLKPYIDIGEKNLRYSLWAAPKLKKIEDFFKDINQPLYNLLSSGLTDKILNIYDFNNLSNKIDPKKLEKILGRLIIGSNKPEENRISARLIKAGLDILKKENIKKEEWAEGRKNIYEGTRYAASLPDFFDHAKLFFMPLNIDNVIKLANSQLSLKYGNYQVKESKLFLPSSKVAHIPFGMNFSFTETIPTLKEFAEIKIIEQPSERYVRDVEA